MKLFQVLLTGADQTIALVVGAEDLESAEKLALKEYGEEEEEDDDADTEHEYVYDYSDLQVYSSYEISGGSAHEEFVCEVFHTNML